MACRICLYGYNIVRWLDQGLNALTGGDPRQTVSARLGRAEIEGVAWAARACAVLGSVLSWLGGDAEHCRNSVRASDGTMEVLDVDGPNDVFPDLVDAAARKTAEFSDSGPVSGLSASPSSAEADGIPFAAAAMLLAGDSDAPAGNS